MLLDFYDCVDFKTYPNWQDYITNQETNTCIISNFLRNARNRQRSVPDHTKNKTLYNLSAELFLYTERRIHLSLVHR